MNIEYLESLPDEVVCNIVSNISNSQDISTLLNVSPRISNIVKSCITRLYGDNIPPEFSFLFPNLTSVGTVDITDAGQLSYLASLPKLKSAIINNDVIGDLDPDYVAYTPNIFLSLYANTYSNINGKIVRNSKTLDDVYFHIYGGYEAIISGNQFKSPDNPPGVRVYLASELINDENAQSQMGEFILRVFAIQNANQSLVSSIMLPLDSLSIRLRNIVHSSTKKIPTGEQTIYEISSTNILLNMIKIVRKLRVYIYDLEDPIDITQHMQRLKYKNLEYLDGPFDVESFLTQIDHRVNFPNLKTMGFYVEDPTNLEFLEVLNPTIQTVILYVPDDSSPLSRMETSRNIIVRPISQTFFNNLEYTVPESYLGIYGQRDDTHI